MARTVKAHPLMILKFLAPYLFFLLIPVIRGVLTFLYTGSVKRFLLQETFILIVILGISILQWHSLSIRLNGNLVTVKSGVFIRRKATINTKKLSTAMLVKNPLFALFHSVLLQINTEAGNRGNADFSVLLYQKDSAYFHRILPEKPGRNSYKISVFRVILMAAGASSAATGLLIAAPIVNHIGSVINIRLSRVLLSSISNTARQLSLILPPLIGGVTLLLLAGFTASFLNNLIRTLRFQLDYDEKSIEISSGWLFKYQLWFTKVNINSLILQSNPFFLLFRQASVKVNIAGYGNKKGQNAVLMPLVPIKMAEKELQTLYPLGRVQTKVTPIPNTLFRFLFFPLLSLFLLFPVSVLLSSVFGQFFPIVSILTAAIGFIIFYFALLSAEQHKRSEFSLREDGRLALTGAKRLSLCSLHCHKSKIGYIRLTRFPVDRRKNTCNLSLIIRSQSSEQLSVLHLNYTKLKELLLNELWKE